VPGAHAFDYWFTTSEWGSDHRTGALGGSRERARRPEDRPGKADTVWDWAVQSPRDANGDRTTLARGTAQNQAGARRAMREVVRELPDKPAPQRGSAVD
jgi:hypothetical protein